MQVIGGGGWSTGPVGSPSPVTIQSSTYPEVLCRASNASLGIIPGAIYEFFLSSCLYDLIVCLSFVNLVLSFHSFPMTICLFSKTLL